MSVEKVTGRTSVSDAPALPDTAVPHTPCAQNSAG